MQWRSKKVEIEEWLEEKVHEFTHQESAFVGDNVDRFKDKYLFECLDEVLYAEFPRVFHE